MVGVCDGRRTTRACRLSDSDWWRTWRCLELDKQVEWGCYFRAELKAERGIKNKEVAGVIEKGAEWQGSWAQRTRERTWSENEEITWSIVDGTDCEAVGRDRKHDTAQFITGCDRQGTRELVTRAVWEDESEVELDWRSSREDKSTAWRLRGQGITY